MKHTAQIRVDNPCQESWDRMHPLPGGRFCAHCEKTVVDFSHFTDRQLAAYFRDALPGRTCGRFRADQLGRSLFIPPPPRRLHGWRWVGAVASGLLLGTGTAWGQQASPALAPAPVHTEQPAETPTPQPQERVLRGQVVNQAGEPLAFANILLYQGGQMIKGRTSDTSGFFEFPIPADADTFQITCSYIGYETVTATYSDGQDEMVTIQLKAGALLPEVVVMAEGRRLRRYLTGGGQTFYHEQSSPAPVVEPLATPEVHIYPNPFTESVQLRLTLEQAGRLRLHLFNTQGELLQMSAHDLPAGPQELTFRLRDPQWPAGIYFLRLLDEHGEIMTRQLIKGH